jgi:hypothetical protein
VGAMLTLLNQTHLDEEKKQCHFVLSQSFINAFQVSLLIRVRCPPDTQGIIRSASVCFLVEFLTVLLCASLCCESSLEVSNCVWCVVHTANVH